ncbi:MAG TPA: ABC transporter substrate-binding protein [Candidatus Dormibacteraeota bacterium]|nr:ABC transporter substrate-binding protein [Candidatus Dormibacteraeota bacterium]
MMRGLGWWLASLLVLVACGGGGNGSPQGETLRIGALLSLTGGWSSLGQTSQAAMEVAAGDVNDYLHVIGSDLRVEVEVSDTQLEPDLAAAALQDFAHHGVRVVVGPQSSVEVRAVKPIADQLGVLAISQGSTAHSLAVPGDNIVRLCPDDEQEGPAIAALMIAEGKTAIVGVSRSDDGNLGLQTSAGASFTARGGTVLDGIVYAVDQTDFSATVADLAARVGAAITAHGADAVGVYLTAFDEAAQLFAAAAPYPALAGVRWYGSDGVVASQALLVPTSAPFANAVGYPCPIFGLDPNAAPLREPVARQVEDMTGFAPDAFGLSTYDAVWLITLSYLQAGGTEDLARYKDAFTRTAETYFGVTGWTRLNGAGDRAAGAFDFSGICPSAYGYFWKHVGTYEPTADGAGLITFAGCSG